MKAVEQSVGSSKRPQVKTPTIDPSPPEERHFDPMAAVSDDGVDEVDLDTDGAQTADPSVTPHLSLSSMTEMFMTTQAAHGQLLNELLAEFTSLRTDFDEYRSAFPPPPPLDS